MQRELQQTNQPSNMSERPSFLDTPLPSAITEFTVQITSNVDGHDHYASGTGVIVAPHLAFAARHVFEDHWRRHHHHQPMPIRGEGSTRFSFVLAQLVGNDLNLWSVTRLWMADLTDIVLLRLTPYSTGAAAYKFRHLVIDLAPPRVGERIHAFGYSDNVTLKEGPNEVTLQQRAATTHGHVVEVFHHSRDSIRMPFPCFRTNARFDGGMSGGPVFNESGQLCGLICSTYPPFTPDEEHASYAVSLWPAVAIPVDLDRRGHPTGVRYRTFDLVADNILIAKNADRVVIDPLPEDGGVPRVGFRIPQSQG